MNLALYGTLRDTDVLNFVLQGAPLGNPPLRATIAGYVCLRIVGESYPLLHSDPLGSTTFDLYHDISQDSWRRLLEYEGEEYFPALIPLNDKEYHVFLAHKHVQASDDLWTLENFQKFDKLSYLRGLS